MFYRKYRHSGKVSRMTYTAQATRGTPQSSGRALCRSSSTTPHPVAACHGVPTRPGAREGRSDSPRSNPPKPRSRVATTPFRPMRVPLVCPGCPSVRPITSPPPAPRPRPVALPPAFPISHPPRTTTVPGRHVFHAREETRVASDRRPAGRWPVPHARLGLARPTCRFLGTRY